MCGIAGYFGDFSPDILVAGLRAIAHRGPDDSGMYTDREAGVGLGHTRLSIIDLSPLGHQPMWDPEARACIVFNGEIYNFRELRSDLEKKGVRFRGKSDTEVLLHSYLAYGEDMLPKLNGIFAFAVWDARDRTMLLARDGVGTKPLYYAQTSRGFLFASEMKALLHEPSLPRAIDPMAVASHLTFLWCPSPATMFSGVRKCRPGHAMKVRDGRVTKEWCHYVVPIGRARRWEGGAEAAMEAVRKTLGTAVEDQMVSDVPVGAFLSGGLDSSSVVAFAKRHAQGRLQCFTIELEGKAASEGVVDDLPYARRVARHLDVDLHAIRVGPEMSERIPSMIWQLDEPQADPAPLNALFISQLARSHGIKVLLSGAGGDDIFTGYRRHFALAQEGLWSWLPRPVRGAMTAASRRLPMDRPWARRIGKAFAYAGEDAATRLVSYFCWLDPRLVVGMLHPDLRAAVRAEDVVDPLIRSATELPAGATPLDRMLLLETRYFLADHNLNYTDKMSMAAGVEVRVPLLDPRLVELAAGLPDSFKQRGGTGKWIFKRAMEPYLPREVIYRPKTGFGAPLRRWLKNELKPMVEDVLNPSSLSARGLFDPRGVKRLVELDRAGKVDASYTVFCMMCVEIWCRMFIDGAVPAPSPRNPVHAVEAPAA